jgi:sortilin-related receptor
LQPTTLEVYALNDTRQQLMVHWAGENSRVIICLAKDRVISSSPDGGAKFLRPSTVYISYDFGSTYKNKTDHFKLDDSQNSSYANLDKFYNHNKFSSHVSVRLCILEKHLTRQFFLQFIFTDSKNKVIFTTNDYGKTVKRQNVDFEISELVFHEEEPETIIVLDENSGERKV